MAKKTEESYEEQIRREFEETQITETQETFKDIGKVDLNKGIDINNEPEIKRINSSIGYINVPVEDLPSMGRYYPEDIRISIRSARVGEIREFSTLDEDNPKDVTDKMTYIVSQCVKIYYGNTPGHYKDLVSADRIVLILKIRELTFIDGQTSIKIPIPSGACKTVGCKPQESIDFNSTMLTFTQPAPELEKYYDNVNRCYNIQTKNFGNIQLYIPTIGLSTIITDWVYEQQQKNQKPEVTLAEILQFTLKDWRGVTEKVLFNKITELSGWSTEKFTLVYRLIEKISVGIEFEITTTCAQCGGEIKVPITFPDGYRSLFIPTISDLGDELL